MEHCAGIIIIRKIDAKSKKNPQYRLLVCHPGGPYFEGKDVWGFPKGHIEDGEEAIDTAIRETFEETGFLIDKQNLIELGTFKQNSKKQVTMFYTFQDIKLNQFKSNECEIEYHGEIIKIPENDQVKWTSITQAHNIIFDGQKQIVNTIGKVLVDEY